MPGFNRRGRALIIDDNLSLAENIAEFLALEGFETEIAASGFEAVLKAFPLRPDVVVTDYRLPDTNGANVLRSFREMGWKIRAIVVSASTDDATVDDVRGAGAAFLPKPTDFEVLGRLLREEADRSAPIEAAADRPSAASRSPGPGLSTHPDRDDGAGRMADDVLGDAPED